MQPTDVRPSISYCLSEHHGGIMAVSWRHHAGIMAASWRYPWCSVSQEMEELNLRCPKFKQTRSQSYGKRAKPHMIALRGKSTQIQNGTIAKAIVVALTPE
jgi:hypothetical protein